jgi:hypothetical protein
MSGFPTRPRRDDFAPELKADGDITDDDYFVGERQFNLSFWQTAGMGLVSSRAIAALDWDSGTSTLSLDSAEEAWDPYGTQNDPTVARSGAGVYTLTYDSTYLNQKGVSISTALKRAAAFVQTTSNYRAVAKVQSNGYVVDINVFDADAGTPVDADVFVVLW